MRYSPIKVFVVLLALGLGQSCQLISGVSSSNTIDNAQTTSYSFDQLVTSFMPSDGSILTLDGHMVITFTPIVTLLDHSSEGIKITKKSNGEEIPFEAEINYSDELGAYQMTIEALSLLEPYREYDLQMTSDFIFMADGIYQKLGEQESTLNFRAAKAGALTIDSVYLPIISSIGDKFVVAGAADDPETAEEGFVPMIGIVGFDEDSFRWKLEKYLFLDIPVTPFSSILSIVVDGDSTIYALSSYADEEESIYELHMFEYDGRSLSLEKTIEVVGMTKPYASWGSGGFASPINMRIFKNKLYIPMTVVMPDVGEYERNGAVILVADLNLTGVTSRQLWDSEDADSQGIMDLQYCDGMYYASAVNYAPPGVSSDGCLAFIASMDDPDDIATQPSLDNIVDMVQSRDLLSVMNSIECIDNNLVINSLESEISLSVSTFDSDGKNLWDLPMTWATFPIGINARGVPSSIPFGLATNGSDKIYVSSPNYKGTSLDVVNASDGTLINHFSENVPFSFNYNIAYGDEVVSTSTPKIIAFGVPLSEMIGETKILFFDERGNTPE